MTTSDAYALALSIVTSFRTGGKVRSMVGATLSDIRDEAGRLAEIMARESQFRDMDRKALARESLCLAMTYHWIDNGQRILHIDSALEAAIDAAGPQFTVAEGWENCPYPSVLLTRDTLAKPVGALLVHGLDSVCLMDGKRWRLRAADERGSLFFSSLAALWDAMAHECVTAEAAAPKKKAAKRLRTSRAAGASVSVLRIRVPEMMREVVARDDSGGGGSHASPSLHLVRSHDHRYWVGAGDKKKLEVRHLAAYWRGSGQAGPRVTKVKGVR